MGVISESAVWEDNVLQIEVGDPVGGGPSAVANLQAQDLANRTKWLKENKLDASNFGEFYPTGLTPTYVDATHFTVAGDLTGIFTKGRVLKITDTGGTVYAVVKASVYDTVTTVTIAGDTINSGISAVLYAVSQQTSAIWESGRNGNGSYVKLTDGTMICRWKSPFASITVPPSTPNGPHFWTYPAQFIDLTNVIAVVDYGGTAMDSLRACVAGVTASQLQIYVVNGDTSANVTSSPSDILMYSAIGRWF